MPHWYGITSETTIEAFQVFISQDKIKRKTAALDI